MSDPFALLGLPRGFRLDETELHRRHLELSLRWHPDRFVLRPAAERLQAEDEMARLNQAYGLLRDPARRAEALLALRGAPAGEGTDATSSPEFLMEMMELKEEAAEAAAERDRARLQELLCGLNVKLAQEVEELGGALDELPGDPVEAATGVAAARARLTEIAYLRKTRETLERALIPRA
ncbi:MAG: Fe-S protein assembly co-chaperone HscB [Planctomycetes bacterium]|nr:Fe-S protein assembly co-chaperone HscB [Planctomycetota bacterium]MBL7007820.1 Fe-S protein assembly co-chaperone HscB [Planctomycetota bacterium]